MQFLKNKPPKLLTAIGGALIVGLLATIIILAIVLHKKQAVPTDPGAQATQIITEVGALYELPTNETPTVVRIQDKNQLKDQPFFTNAQDGDYALIFRNHKFGMLYRHQTHKLINVAPINLQDGQKAGN
jgi:hypothetical protein